MKHTYTSFIYQLRIWVLAVAFGLFGLSDLSAQNPEYSNGPLTGTGGNSIPFSWSSAGARGQLLYPAGIFGSNLPSGEYITKLYFSANATGGPPNPVTYQFIEIALKQDNLSSLNSGSWETGTTVVLSESNFSTYPVAYQWYSIELTTPFLYDPDVPLIVDVKTHMASYSAWYSLVAPVQAGCWRAYAQPYTSASPSGNGAYCLYMGFDLEGASVPDNAGISGLPSISDGFCAGTQSVTAEITNYGNNTLDSVYVDWTVNGNAQTGQWFNLGLDTAGSGNNDTIVTLGSQTFVQGQVYDVVAWTTMPNGVPDTVNINDTTSLTVGPALAGTYVIGSSSSADYPTFNDAVDDLMLLGVCDTVIFNVEAGTYEEQVQIDEILGSSPTRPVYFQSITGNFSDVHLIQNSTSSGSNFVLNLNGASYVTFQDMSIRNTSSGTYSNAVAITGGAHYNTFDECLIKAGPTTYTGAGNYSTGIYMYGNNDGNTITNNRIEGGSCNIYCYGGGTTSRVQGLTVEDNELKNSYRYTLYCYYTDGLELHRNVITNDSAMYLYGYGPYLVYVDDFNITRNRIGTDIQNGYYYGVYMNNCVGANNPKSQFANNCVFAGSATGSSYGYYGMYMTNSGIVDYHNNSITRRGNSGNYYALSVNGGGLISLKNNVFYNESGGYALYVPSGFSISESDYNNFYTNSGTLIYYSGSTYSSSEAYSVSSGYDMHSMESDPAWETDLNCITCNLDMDNAGTVLDNVTNDHVGNVRSVNTPDIGAYEYVNGANFDLGPDTTICADSYIVDAGPALSVFWIVNSNTANSPSYELVTGNAPVTFDVYANVSTEYCGNGDDTVQIILVPNANLDDHIHICSDETTDLVPGGGSTATYAWSTNENTPMITVSEPGTYSVVKTEEGCESEATIQVTQSVGVDIIDIEACEEDAPVSVNGAVPGGTSYAWSGGDAPNASLNTFDEDGTYTVTATDSFSCVSMDEFSLVILGEPVPVITYQTTAGTAVFFSSQTSQEIGPNSTYLWTFNGTDTSTAAEPVYVFPWSNEPTTYNVTLEIDNGCGFAIDQATIGVTSVGEITADNVFHLFPNPTDDHLTIVGNGAWSSLEVAVLDQSGRTVSTKSYTAGNGQIDMNVSDLAAGVYMVKLTSDLSTEVHTLIVK